MHFFKTHNCVDAILFFQGSVNVAIWGGLNPDNFFLNEFGHVNEV